MAFTLDNIVFSPTLEPISVTHTVGFGSSLEKTYTIKNNDPNEVKVNIKVPTGIHVDPSFVQLAPNQSQTIRISADRTFFDTLPKGSNRFNVEFQLVGQGDPIDPTSDVIVYELQLTSSPSLSLKVGQTSAVTAQVLEKNLTQQTTAVAMNKIITFQSSNANIITVGQLDGQARAVSPGNAEITVSSQGIGSQRVLVGVFSDPPAPRWWEKIVVNTTSGERFYQGPFYRNIDPYPTRETRNGLLYDVYYQEISEDHIQTTTYYYDWKDVTDSVQGLTDAQKLQAGYISSTSKPVTPSPETVDGAIVRVVTNSKWEQKIVLINVPVTPSPSPIRVTPTRTPSVSPSPSPQIGPPSVTPMPTPTRTPTSSKPPTQLTCWTYNIWFDQASIEIYPPPSIDYTNCNGQIVSALVDFNSTAAQPQKICAYNILSTYRTVVGNSTAGCQAAPPPAPTPSPTKSSYPDVTIAFSVSGGNGTLNGRRTPFTVTLPWATGYSVSLTPDAGYECDEINIFNASGQNTGKVLGCSAMIYASNLTDDVVGTFRLIAPPNPTPSYNSTSTGGGTSTGGTGGTGGGSTGGGGFTGLT